MPLNKWTHLACTYDRVTIRVYVNGEEVATGSLSESIITSSVPLSIGGKEYGSTIKRYFDGLIDEVEIFNRALTAAEIKSIYDAGSAGKVKPPQSAAVRLDFDSVPGGNWELVASGGTSSASDGILTIDAPADFHEFILRHPDDLWHEEVDNSRGWVIETRLLVDASTEPLGHGGRGAVQIWANDHTNLIIVGFSTDMICIAYPNLVPYPMDTTDGYHVYRIESKFDNVKVYVDDTLVIDHTLTTTGSGTDILMFGDGVGGSKSLSYWDYFEYNVFQVITSAVTSSSPGPSAVAPSEERSSDSGSTFTQ